MALISCKECGKEISDKAYSCPNCGCPQRLPDIEFTDLPSRGARAGLSQVESHRPSNFHSRLGSSLLGLLKRLVFLGIVIAGGYAVYHYDVAGIRSLISNRSFLSSKVETAEAYLLERLDKPETYRRLEWGPMEKRYDYGQVGEVYITWVAYTTQDDFGNVKTRKAHFKIDAATGKVIDFRNR